MNVLMPTTLVGSLPQPDWLVRKDVMLASAPPRVRLKKIWRVEEPYLEEAQDDASAASTSTIRPRSKGVTARAKLCRG
jgi:hypothetical protein